MSNNTKFNVLAKVTENLDNKWINWIEEAIAKNYFKYYEFNHFNNLQEICLRSFGKVYRANWKSSHNYLALKTFLNFNNVTIKEIVKEVTIIYFSIYKLYIYNLKFYLCSRLNFSIEYYSFLWGYNRYNIFLFYCTM